MMPLTDTDANVVNTNGDNDGYGDNEGDHTTARV